MLPSYDARWLNYKASVDVSFDPDGSLRTLSGTVGFPELPGMGMFDELGPLSSTAPSLETSNNRSTPRARPRKSRSARRSSRRS